MRTLALVVVLLAACSGDAPPAIDANPLGPLCSKMTYDLCLEEHDCVLGVCQTFTAQNFQVCTVPCGAGCPNDKTGAAGVCDPDTMSCRPSAPNMCHL